MAVPASFLQKLAARLGLSPAGLAFIEQWQPFEGGGDKNNAAFNPLNTTQNAAGAQSINSVGVKAYTSEDQGVEATAQTLENGYYDKLLAGLRSGNIDPAAVAPEIRTWGSGNFANQLDGGGGGSGDGGSGMPDSPWYTKYAEVYSAWAPLDDKYRMAQESKAEFDPNFGLVAGAQAAGADANGNTVAAREGRVLMTPDEYQTYISLDRQLGDLENEFQTSAGGGTLDEAIKRATFSYGSDPRNIDAENAAKKYAREMDVRQQATSLANNQLQQQSADQKDATKSYNDFVSTPSWGQTFQAPQTNLPSADQLFERAVATVKKGLPDVPNAPYYSGSLPGAGSMPSLGAIRRQATTPKPAAPKAVTGVGSAISAFGSAFGRPGSWSSLGTDAPNPLVSSSGGGGVMGLAGRVSAPFAPLNTSARPPLNPWDARQPQLPNNRAQVGFRGSLLYGR